MQACASSMPWPPHAAYTDWALSVEQCPAWQEGQVLPAGPARCHTPWLSCWPHSERTALLLPNSRLPQFPFPREAGVQEVSHRNPKEHVSHVGTQGTSVKINLPKPV